MDSNASNGTLSRKYSEFPWLLWLKSSTQVYIAKIVYDPRNIVDKLFLNNLDHGKDLGELGVWPAKISTPWLDYLHQHFCHSVRFRLFWDQEIAIQNVHVTNLSVITYFRILHGH